MRNPRVYEWTIVLLLMLMWGVVGLNRIGIAYLFPILVPRFHLAYWQVGLLLSGTSVTWALSTWFGGNLSDRVGRKWVFIPALTFAALVSALIGAVWNFLSLFIVRDLIGLGDGVGWSVGEAAVAEVSSPERKAFNQGLYMGGYTIMGTGFGAIIITQLALHLGWRWVYAVIAVFALGVLALLARWMREPRAIHGRTSGGIQASLHLLGNRQVLLLVGLNILILTWLQGFNGYASLFLTRVDQFPLAQAGYLLSIGGIVGFIGQFALPYLSDRVGRRPVVVGAASLAAASLIAMSQWHLGPGLLAVLIAVNGFFGWGLQPIAMATVVSESVPPSLVGNAIGLTNFFGVVVGTMVMPLALGVIAGHWGLATAILVVGLAEALILPLGWALRETAPRRAARSREVLTSQSLGL